MNFLPSPSLRSSARQERLLLLLPVLLTLTYSAHAGSLPKGRELADTAVSVILVQPEGVVIKAVEAVADDSVVHGTWVYDRDKAPMLAHVADQSASLEQAAGPARTFYKVAEGVIAPRFFKESEDIGTVTVRYVVQAVDPAHTQLSIDAVYVDIGRKAHHSTGIVEQAEYGAVRDELERIKNLQAQQRVDEARVDAYRATEKQTREGGTVPQQQAALPANQGVSSSVAAQPFSERAAEAPGPARTGSASTPADSGASLPPAQPTPPPATSTDATEQADLEQRVRELRHKVEMRVIAPGTAVKSAPFHSASTITSVARASDVLILVITPHWYGVETADGHHGWIHGSQLEPLP